MILPRNMYKTRRKPKTKYFCGNCAKELGRGSRQHPSVWCNVCGWVHFACSGLKQLKDYKKTKPFYAQSVQRQDDWSSQQKKSLHIANCNNLYTSCNNPSAFGSRTALKQTSKCTFKQVDNYLNRSETYSKFKQTRNRFLRLKVQSYRLNEIWSIDLADMQKLARHNHGVNFILVAVDTLSRFVWAMPLKRKTAIECKMLSNPLLTISTPEERINQTL